MSDTNLLNQDVKVHIRLEQRASGKYLTTVQGISNDMNILKILKAMKKRFICNGCIVEDKESGTIIKLQGDQRRNVMTWLVNNKLYDAKQIKIHDY